MTFIRRRLRNSLILTAAIAVVYVAFEVLSLSLQTQQYYSGWLVFALIIFLLFYYIKKRLSVVPLGTNAAWAQWHYYVGLFLFAAFLIHIEFSIPNGFIESILAALLAAVIAAGILGVIINRRIAKRLTYANEEIIFERIPELRMKLKVNLETELLQSIEQSQSPTLSTYYLKYLADYFSSPRDFVSHLFGSHQPHTRRMRALEQQMRYLNNQESVFAVRIGEYLEQKNTLDCHYASQILLKYWGVIHGPIAVLLLFMTLVHIVLVYAFRGAV